MYPEAKFLLGTPSSFSSHSAGKPQSGSSAVLAWAVVSTAGNIILLLIIAGIASDTFPFVSRPSLANVQCPRHCFEELRPANEELTRVKGELHAADVELSTVQGELPPANEELPRGEASPADCITPDYPLEGPGSDWYTLKGIPPPDPCLVQGFVLERLEPEYNFRRGYALGLTSDVEDRSHIIPYLRAFQDRTMATRKRRVLIDLGGNGFDMSTLWFLRNYPLSFTEIHVFEVRKGMFQIPSPQDIPPDLLQHMSQSSRVPGAGSLPVPEKNLKGISLHEAYVGTRDSGEPGGESATVNITRFLLEELKLSPQDTVVVKMDIEYAEWDILPVWLGIPEMPAIVDELFIEIHYNETTMYDFLWNTGPPRESATKMFKSLRTKGFFTHPWP